MDASEIRRIENFVLSRPLSQINDPDNLQFLAALIQDHEHLREKLQTEPDRRVRRAKFEAMRAYLRFAPDSFDHYELAQQVSAAGVQPIYEEQQQAEQNRLWMPPSAVYEVR